jgi:hypothetical protein
MTDIYPRRNGRARRLIDIRRWDERTVTGWLEDDFHHFGVIIVHDQGRVVDVSVATARFPYSTCAAAAQPLNALIGAPLYRRASDIGLWIDMRLQCTHLFDLAGLVLAHAASGRSDVRFEATVEDREVVKVDADYKRTLGPGSATLFKNERMVLSWDIDRHAIMGPAEWAGQSLKDGFRERTEAMDVDAAEHATILRRAVMVAGGRSADRAAMPLPGARTAPAPCHTFQPGQREDARWIPDSLRNFEASSAGMLAHVEERPWRSEPVRSPIAE